MKRCPFCAEEIQDAAIVCRFCKRDLPVSPTASVPPPVETPGQPAPTSSGRKWVGVVFGLLLVLGLIVGGVKLLSPSYPAAPSQYVAEETARKNTALEPMLQISGERGRLGLDFTNREPSSLSQCRASITDAQGTNWVAYVTTVVAPLESATMWWRDFRHEGQELPAEIGRERGITVSCVVDSTGHRRNAALWR